MTFRIGGAEGKRAAVDYINGLSDSKPFTVEVRMDRKSRTLPQNKLYHLWLRCIASETGDDVEFLHSYFASRYLGTESMQVFGETHTRPVSTASLTTEQFTEYLERIDSFVTVNLGFPLPHPDDNYFNEFVERYGRT